MDLNDDEWETNLKRRLQELDLNRTHIIMLRIRLYNMNYPLTHLDDEAFNIACYAIEEEMEKIKGELAIERLLQGKI